MVTLLDYRVIADYMVIYYFGHDELRNPSRSLYCVIAVGNQIYFTFKKAVCRYNPSEMKKQVS